jgi:hypothetical protein
MLKHTFILLAEIINSLKPFYSISLFSFESNVGFILTQTSMNTTSELSPVVKREPTDMELMGMSLEERTKLYPPNTRQLLTGQFTSRLTHSELIMREKDLEEGAAAWLSYFKLVIWTWVFVVIAVTVWRLMVYETYTNTMPINEIESEWDSES